RLLEDIWGTETSTEKQELLQDESSKIEPSTHIRESDITVEIPPFDPPQTDKTPTSTSQKDAASISPTVRVNVEHLEYLNYSIGELLTNQNRQSLQNEQLKAAVRTLVMRLQQHQQLLGELQDWSDRQYVDAEQWQMQSSIPPLGMRDNGSWILGKMPRSPQVPTQNPLSKIHTRFDSLELDRYSEVQLLVQSILEDAVQLTEATEAIDLFATQGNQTLEKQRRLLTSTRDALVEARMLPLGDIFNRFYRVLQQLEVTHHKRVTLKLHGSDVLVDKVVAEKLYDPLLHLVRNAFDHGIESPGIRQRRGKLEKGQIEISASHQGRHLLIQVRDDGQGLDFDKIRQRAIELLFSPEQVNRLTQAQLTDLLFEPGFSTTSVVNDLSGRGIGLNVVRAQMDNLQGSVAVDSELGKGTTFTLHIPLNLTITKLLICQANNRVYALLTDAIEQILIPQSDQIRSWDEGKVLRLGKGSDERLIPVHHLAKVLDYFSLVPTPPVSHPQHSIVARGQAVPIILMRHQNTVIGLEVDQLFGEQELAIRPLGATISPPHYVYGGSVLADGQLALVLDGSALMQHIWDKQAEGSPEGKSGGSSSRLLSCAPQPQLLPAQTHTALPAGRSRDGEKSKFSYLVNPRRVVLLVDDSITLRQTLALTLQKAGYQVLQAKDGYEAIEQLQSQSDIRLVICDIEMPRMNGFEFLKYRQHEPDLAKIPVVILTSRSGEKHRLIAEELGATAYITKPFLEHNLLMMVSEAIEQKMLVS
ncbi:MAG TPA: response regulator, partial [Coleofasciculaceae cyanobacterium]